MESKYNFYREWDREEEKMEIGVNLLENKEDFLVSYSKMVERTN